jgi:hypothetical protein
MAPCQRQAGSTGSGDHREQLAETNAGSPACQQSGARWLPTGIADAQAPPPLPLKPHTRSPTHAPTHTPWHVDQPQVAAKVAGIQAAQRQAKPQACSSGTEAVEVWTRAVERLRGHGLRHLASASPAPLCYTALPMWDKRLCPCSPRLPNPPTCNAIPSHAANPTAAAGRASHGALHGCPGRSERRPRGRGVHP